MNISLRSTAAVLLMLAFSAFSFAAEDEQGFIILQKDDFKWQDNDRIQTINIHGDPSQEGFYIIRIRFPAGASSRPHSHSQDRFITVIDGTWYAGTGADYDMDKTAAIKAGGFMKHPAGAIHFDGAKDEAVVVEIRGMGPVTTSRAGG